MGPAAAPDLARLSVARRHGADYYLSLGTSPPAGGFAPSSMGSLLREGIAHC
jgi:hypothetical protein